VHQAYIVIYTGKTVYGPVLKTTQLSARAQNHASPERCRKSFTILYHQFSPPHLTHYKPSLFPLQQLNITIRQHTQKFTVKAIFCELSKVNKIVELERCE